ncbi:MAG TPA: hypothetical protein VG125_24960 [Pirellulales bacterium]|jgi:hypothetical protein|nr:hypothetical protein [Pirellulales bacterium]
MSAGAKSSSRSFRVTIGLLVGASVGLALITLVAPDVMLVGAFTFLAVVALPFAVLIDFVPPSAQPQKLQFSLRQLFIVVACLALYLSLLREPWTFRLRFAVSRPALERLAAEVEQGGTPGPQWAGLFYIEETARRERDGGTYTVLFIDPEEGFVHPTPTKPWLNDYSLALQNDPEWFYFIQD